MISVVIPMYNEEKGAAATLTAVAEVMRGLEGAEIIVVNDGSTDATAEAITAAAIANTRLISHPENMGYGKSLTEGILAAKNECIAIIDGDGSYPPAAILELYKHYPAFDMIVGARQGWEYRKGLIKGPARMVFRALAEYAAGRSVPDVNSGLRIFKRSVLLRFQDSLCAGFSFTTTITLLFMLNSYYVKYIPVEYNRREGKSKVRHFRDTLRAAQYIVEAILFYNPMKLFLLLASVNLIAGGILAVANQFLRMGVFYDFLAAGLAAGFIPIFCMGLLADQLRKIYNSFNRADGK